ARRNKAVEGNVAALLEEHVIQQRRIVGFVYLRRLLHGARRKAYFASLYDPPFSQFEFDPFALDGIAVFDRHFRVRLREVAQLDTLFFGSMKLGGEILDGAFWQHSCRLDWLVGRAARGVVLSAEAGM